MSLSVRLFVALFTTAYVIIGTLIYVYVLNPGDEE